MNGQICHRRLKIVTNTYRFQHPSPTLMKTIWRMSYEGFWGLKIFSYDTENKSKIWCQFHFSLFDQNSKKCLNSGLELNFTKMFLGGVSICPWCVIGGDVGGGKFAPSKNPPILELHPRKKPENYFKKKTQNSQSQFQIFLNGFQRENKNLVLVENPNPWSLPKTFIPYPKNCLNLTIW